MTNLSEFKSTIFTWLLVAFGWMVKIIPVLQFCSLTLASVVSLVTLYRMFTPKSNTHDKDKHQ